MLVAFIIAFHVGVWVFVICYINGLREELEDAKYNAEFWYQVSNGVGQTQAHERAEIRVRARKK